MGVDHAAADPTRRVETVAESFMVELVTQRDQTSVKHHKQQTAGKSFFRQKDMANLDDVSNRLLSRTVCDMMRAT